MKKPKVYVYPSAQDHAHDSIPHLVGVVPFSKAGIEYHFEKTENPEDADIFYMGQFSCGNRRYARKDYHFFGESNKLHVADIEGDWEHDNVSPELLRGALVSINCAKSEYKNHGSRMFVRPTFSKLLIELARETRKFSFSPNTSRVFGFRGQLDPSGTRMKTAQACELARVRHEIYFNEESYSRVGSGTKSVEDYIENLENSTFSLCPRGVGKDTIRFFEACAMGRIPIVVAGIEIFQENEVEPFWFKVHDGASVKEISDLISSVNVMSDSEIVRRQNLAYQYFNTRVKEYFDDPTLIFMKWIEKVRHQSGV